MLRSVTDYYRVLQCYRVLQSIAEYYRVLQSITKYYKVLQCIIKTNLAHLLRPIFGLVSFIVDENKNQGKEIKSLAANLICILMYLDFA